MHGRNKLVFRYSRLELLASDKPSSLLDPFVSCNKNKVLWIQSKVRYKQHFIFSKTCEWPNKLLLPNTTIKKLAGDNYPSLLAVS